ncbi:Protein NRT1/ PTR FAMILY 2.8, partial [Cucurbita argyrosperma subsp. argyrosperma]
MYNLDSVDSAYVFQIWSGTTNFAALAGAFLADAYLGRFYTLLFGSFASLLGMGVLTLGAGFPEMRPPPCRHGEFLVFDKAATVVDSSTELDEQGKSKNEWKLCSVHQVEQFKCFVGIVPIWAAGIPCFISMQQMGSFGILQAIQMNRFIGPHFQIPPAWMSLTPMIALSIWIYIYEKYVEFMKKKTHKNKRFSLKTRIEIGIVMSVLCMVVAGILENIRRSSAEENKSFVSPLHVWMLIPEFALSGLTEAFAAIAVMELLTTHLPESLRTHKVFAPFLSLF